MKAELLVHAPPAGARAGGRKFPDLWRFAEEYLLVLPLGAVVALVWANADAESYFRTAYAIAFAVNDVAMAFFFALIAKEVVEATVPGGVLHPWRRATLPVIASIGLATVSIVAYLAFVRLFGEPPLQQAWPVVLTTDLAVAYFVARMIFGKHPAVPFLLLIAISANGIGFGALGLFGTVRDVHLLVAVSLMTAALASAYALRRARVRSFWPYLIVGGSLSWCALFFGGFHPALALMPIVPFLPHAARDPGFFVDAPVHARDALNRLEILCRHPAQAALFLFGLVNAGVPLRALEAGMWSLPVAMLVGKPAGLAVGAALALALGLHLPKHVDWRTVIVLGFISAIGFTMSLFFAASALGVGPVLSEMKMGSLLTLAAGGAAFAAARLLKVGRFQS